MKVFKFITPFYYTFAFNRRGLEGVAYLLEYTLLPFVFVYLYMPTLSLWIVALIVTIVTIIYEMGYIYNNTISIRKESNPTLRHTQEELDFGYRYRVLIASIRYGFASLLLVILFFLYPLYSYVSLLGIVVISVVFYLYNTYREGRYNRALFFLLRLSRYFFVLFYDTFGVVVSFVLSMTSLINNFAWYPTRSSMALPRFFGTKLFDSIVYGFIVLILYIVNYERFMMIFLYLMILKLILFSYKLATSYR